MKHLLSALALCLGVGLFLAPGACFALTVSAEGLPDRPVLAPAGGNPEDIKGVVLQFSDIDGWNSEDDALSAKMVASGLAVIQIDFRIYADEMAHSEDFADCFYISGDIHDLAKAALHALGVDTWHRPMLVGRGQGATFVYSTLAVGPDNTFSGAVALDSVEPVMTRLPTCAGAAFSKAVPAGWSYGYDVPLAAGLTYVAPQAVLDAIRPKAANRPEISFLASDTLDDRIAKVAEKATDVAVKDAASAALPIVDVPLTGKARAVAVFWSGDGGWRDIDMEIGNWLGQHGIRVVGVDSLRYFWNRRTPDEITRDTVAAIRHADPTGQLPVLLLGFSFGADILPFAYNRLDPDIQARVKNISMLSGEMKTSFQVSVEGFLFSSTGDTDILPEAIKLPPAKVLCLYGADDADVSLCANPAMKAYPQWVAVGDHHFDGAYTEIGQRILDAFTKASAPR